MSNDQMNNDQLQEDLTEVLRVRREKLTKLQDMGRDPLKLVDMTELAILQK